MGVSVLFFSGTHSDIPVVISNHISWMHHVHVHTCIASICICYACSNLRKCTSYRVCVCVSVCLCVCMRARTDFFIYYFFLYNFIWMGNIWPDERTA